MYRKLSAVEITAVVTKIRGKYNEYCKRFFKPKRLKEEFENRYLMALRRNVDISNFLLAEISAIEELLKKEERKLEQMPVRETAQPVKKDFADKIIEENLKKIEKYPALSFQKDANIEIKRLLGALNDLYEKEFPKLHALLRVMPVHAGARDLADIENNLRKLAYMGNDQVSTQLTRYYTLLNRFPRDYRALEREEKEFILESAFLLHDLQDILAAIQKQNATQESKSTNGLAEILSYVDGIIADFRLKELKRRK